MAGINVQTIIGNLGRDPELKYSKDGAPICKFSVAVTENYKGNEQVEWFNIVAFGPLAEACSEYLYKGRQVYIAGRTKTNEYKDKEGNEKRFTEVVAQNMQMLGPKKEGGAETKSDADKQW